MLFVLILPSVVCLFELCKFISHCLVITNLISSAWWLSCKSLVAPSNVDQTGRLFTHATTVS